MYDTQQQTEKKLKTNKQNELLLPDKMSAMISSHGSNPPSSWIEGTVGVSSSVVPQRSVTPIPFEKEVKAPQPQRTSSRVPSKSEASALEYETKGFLGRRSGVALRAAEYRPTLKTIKSTSFSDYIRGVLMGVPLEGVECEEPYYNDPLPPVPTVSTKKTKKPQPQHSVIPNSVSNDTTETNNGAPPLHPGTPKNSTTEALNIQKSSGNSNFTPVFTRGSRQKEETTSPPTTRMSTRSQTRPKKLTYDKKKLKVSELKSLRARRRKRCPPPMHPCRYKLSDGLAKVTLPDGWWDQAGIARDTTARGRRWQKGSSLGDREVLSPIKQCASGIGGVYEFTMVDQPSMTVAEFRDKADAYRKRQIGSELDDDMSDSFMDDLARKFWRRLGPTMEAPTYGADMEGSFFDESSACGWNVNQLESCLQLLTVDTQLKPGETEPDLRLPGVTTAYLYFGMWASVFAAHTEDKNLLSINYLHAGAPKYWYSISPETSDRFESLMASHFSASASQCSEFLRHKSNLLSPSILSKAGIKFRTQIQRPGDAIITFPGSYHFGFNTGFNVAESTNFAVPEWYPMGARAKVCMCHPHSVRIDMRRFKDLLDLYETDMITDGIPKMAYSEWVKLEIGLSKTDHKKSIVAPSDESEFDIEKWEMEEKLLRTKGRVVEVTEMDVRSLNASHFPPKKKQRTTPSSQKKKKERSFHVALRVRPSVFAPQTPIICLLKCENEAEEKYFSGMITCVVEGHARLHFAGTGKKDDIWMNADNPKLFLDGGLEEEPFAEGGSYSHRKKKLTSQKGSLKSSKARKTLMK